MRRRVERGRDLCESESRALPNYDFEFDFQNWECDLYHALQNGGRSKQAKVEGVEAS